MENFLTKLKNSGLQEYESKAYYILATYGNLSAKDLAIKAEIPQTKVYSTLNKLIDKGLCIKVPGNKKIYKALQPSVAFSPILNEIKNKQSNLEQLVLELEDVYKSENKSIDDYIEVLTNNQQIHEKYVSLKNASQHELIAFIKPPFAHEGKKSKLAKQEQFESDKLKKGLVTKGIYEIPEGENISFLIPHIKRSVEKGEEARMLKSIPIKLHIFDERFVMMALKNSESSDSKLTMISIEHPDLAKAHKMLFEFMWEQAIPFSVYLESIKDSE